MGDRQQTLVKMKGLWQSHKGISKRAGNRTQNLLSPSLIPDPTGQQFYKQGIWFLLGLWHLQVGSCASQFIDSIKACTGSTVMNKPVGGHLHKKTRPLRPLSTGRCFFNKLFLLALCSKYCLGQSRSPLSVFSKWAYQYLQQHKGQEKFTQSSECADWHYCSSYIEIPMTYHNRFFHTFKNTEQKAKFCHLLSVVGLDPLWLGLILPFLKHLLKVDECSQLLASSVRTEGAF